LAKFKVTIGVCVRNGEDNIRDAVESVISQDFPHEFMEVIFVDDGSTDKTLSTIENHVPKMGMNGKVFHHEWKGLGASRNVVVDNANGDYIVWVDSDMVLSKDFVSELVEFMEQHPKVGITKGKQALKSGENLLATLETYSRVAGRMIDYASEKAQSKALGTGGCIYRVKAINQVGGFDESLTGYGEDFDVEYRIRKAGWLLSTIDVQFCDYEKGRILWKDLWRRYLKRGYDLYILSRKRKAMINFYKMLPPAAFLSGLFHSVKIYKLTRQKVAFLLPFQYMFKMSAWCLGFAKSSRDACKTSVSSSKQVGIKNI
jgi:glycosyltransferase involved in cell wall biosynthesis